MPTIFSSKSFNLISNNSKPYIELKNRIIQPSRLQFNWLNKKEEILNQDTGKLDHPILGWLVPNYLDNMVMVYEATGKEIKAIRITDSKKIEEYFPNNDGILKAADIKENRIKNNNSELNEIVDNLDIEKILFHSKKLNEKIGKTISNNSVISLLYGKPIAIAKGEIRMDLLGNAIKNPMWSTTELDDTAAIENHKILIQIGNLELSDDGLLGYYLHNNYSQLVFTDKETKIEISPNNKPINVTVLLSANSGFYIDLDGYLPTKLVNLHKHTTEELINAISISFMLCPFMADKENPKIPIPSTPNSSWNWIHKSNVEVWNNPKVVKEQNNDETFSFNTQQFYEGWIKLEEFKPKQS